MARRSRRTTWNGHSAVATPVRVADVTLLILDPVDRDRGPLLDFANGPNGGVYALSWQVADSDGAMRWFATNPICQLNVEKLDAGGAYSHEIVLDGARHWFI